MTATSPPDTAVSAVLCTSSSALPCVRPDEYVSFRAADGRTSGFEQDAVFYEDAWSADQRKHGGNYTGALVTRLPQ